jgi:hypothetical protein
LWFLAIKAQYLVVLERTNEVPLFITCLKISLLNGNFWISSEDKKRGGFSSPPLSTSRLIKQDLVKIRLLDRRF